MKKADIAMETIIKILIFILVLVGLIIGLKKLLDLLLR